MKHRYLKLFFAALLCIATTGARAIDFRVDGIYYNITDETNKTVEVAQCGTYNKYVGSIDIPSSVTYNGVVYSVTSIGDHAFSGCTGLTSIEFPSSVISIGYQAFDGCTGLTNVTIGNSVTRIEGSAFYECTGLTSIEIPNNVTSIGDDAFRYCTALASITIPNSVTNIEGNAFSNCTALASIVVDSENDYYDSRENCNAIIETETNTLVVGCKNTVIPNCVTSIGNGAFSGCTGLTSITIPNSVTSIGNGAFYNCTGLTSITITNSVTSIGNNAFSNCTSLTNITIPNSVTSIGSNAFRYCTALASIVVDSKNAYYDSRENCNAIIETATNSLIAGCKNTVIPNSVTSIGEDAFHFCEGLTSITIPNSVTSIGNNAFYECTGLTNVTIGNSVTSIGNGAFAGCTGLTNVTIGNSVTSIGNGAFAGCSSLTSITIPNSVTNIGEFAFSDCSDLTSITIPNSVTSIERHTFDGCKGLASVTIPNSVTSIGYGAFQGCTALTSITIPNSVTSIGQYAFQYCTAIASIVVDSKNDYYDSRENCNAIIETATNTLIAGCKNTVIPNSVTSIGEDAFYFCEGLTSITIPNSVTSIGNNAFSGCTGLTSITIPNSVTSIGNGAFIYCRGLTNVTIPNSVTSIGDFAFYECTGLTSITIPNSVTRIGVDAFHGCTEITKIIVDSDNKIYDSRKNCNAIIETKTNKLIVGCKNTYVPSSVTSIGERAFSGCTGLTSIEFPSSVISVGYQAFDGCTGLTNVTIGNCVTSIGQYAFQYCTGLKSVEIPNSVTSIGDHAFQYCTGLKNIKIPNSVIRINTGTFYGCTGLTGIEIPNSVTTIGYGAFTGCTNLKSVIIPNSVTRIGNDAFNECNNCSLVIMHSLNLDFNSIQESMPIYVNSQQLVTKYSEFSNNVKLIYSSYYNTTPTTIKVLIRNNVPEFITALSFNNSEDTLSLFTGLEPDNYYSFLITMRTECGQTLIDSIALRTEQLVFNTLKAKATSNRRAVICAETNISEEESSTGFEWRRIDAPDLVPSEFATCAVHEGVMEGALHNLSANTYYKYRPYYTSQSGKSYYGEWIGFGTSDAYVYFTPTVHTYATASAGTNAARLSGYVLAGSDDIIEQGFEYWPVGKAEAATMHNTHSDGNVRRVTATGQRMSVIIEELEYGTIYMCRAYARTAKETVYGEEQSFETSFPTGIEENREENITIQTAGNTVYINGYNENETVFVYTLFGAVVYNGPEKEITLNSGTYIVKVGNITKKIQIR